MTKGFEAYGKALELKPDDAGYHNNYALALARGKKFPEAQAELTKAAQIDPSNAGKYYYNLGALLVNNQQLEPAGEAFKKAIDSDPSTPTPTTNTESTWFPKRRFLRKAKSPPFRAPWKLFRNIWN